MKTLHDITSKLFSLAGAFVIDSLEEIIIWLIVMLVVIFCDLITGSRRALIMGEDVRFSRAWRATMGKAVTYFSFVVMVVMINNASGKDYNIDKWAVLFICFIEGCSIISNILQPKGYEFNINGLFKAITRKLFGINTDDDIITKN